MRKRTLLVAALIEVIVISALFKASRPHAGPSCTSSTHTVWYGAEHGALATGPGVTTTYRVNSPMTITSVTMSGSFIPTDGASPGGPPVPGWDEALLLTGVSPNRDVQDAWTGEKDPAFGPPEGFFGQVWHGNSPTRSVLASEILKTQEAAQNEAVSVMTDTPVPAGSFLYLYAAVDGPTADVEEQIEVTYTQSECLKEPLTHAS